MCLAPGAQARFWPAGAAAPARLWPAGITEALHLAVFGPPSAWRCSPGHCCSIPGQAHSDDRQCSQGHCDPIPGQPISRMQAARQRRQRQQASRLLQAARGTSLWAGTGVRRPGRRPRLEQSPQSTPEPTPSLPRSQPASQAASQPASQTAAPEQSPQLTPEPTPSQPRSQPEPGPVALSAHQLPAVASATPDRRGPSAPTADHHNTFEGRNFRCPVCRDSMIYVEPRRPCVCASCAAMSAKGFWCLFHASLLCEPCLSAGVCEATAGGRAGGSPQAKGLRGGSALGSARR